MDAKPASSLKTIRLLVILCVLVAASCLTWQAWDMFGSKHRPMLQGWDDSFYYYWLPSVVIDHDVDFTNQLAHSDTLESTAKDLFAAERTATGLLPNKYPPGWAIGSLPFFLFAHLFAPAGTTGFEPIYLMSVWLGQMLYAAIGLWLAVKIAARFFPLAIASVAVLSGWLASPLIYYQTARISMSHSQVFVLAVAVFWLALRIADGDQRKRNWILLGFCAALLIVTRNLAGLYLIGPGWIILRKLRSAQSALWLVLGAVVPCAAQLLAWKIIYGSWLCYSYQGERFNFAQNHLFEILFSPQHGWFYWHPLMCVGVVGFLAWAWRLSPGRAWIASLGICIALNAAWECWWLGSSFGNRGFEASTFFAMLGLAVALQAAEARPALRRALAIIIGAAIAWNLILLALYLTQRISHEDAVTYRDAAQALFKGCTAQP